MKIQQGLSDRKIADLDQICEMFVPLINYDPNYYNSNNSARKVR